MFKSVLTLLLLAGAAAASTVAQPSTGARMRVPPAVAPGAQGAAAAGVMAGPYANSMGMMMGAGSMGAGMMGAGAGMMGPGAAGPGGMGPGPGAGAGLGAGGMGVGGMGMAACGDGDANQCPMQVWMELLMNHDKVERAFTPTASGIESVTTSLDPAVARLIQTHVAQMAALLAACRAAPAKGAPACPGVRRWDPLFAAVFDNAKDITLQVTNKTTPAGAPLGVAAKETGDTDYARRLAQAHAAVVSDFVKRGHVAAMEAHAPPKRG